MSQAAVQVASVAAPTMRACPTCSRDWGAGTACQFCSQVDGMPHGVSLSSPGRRFGAYLLDGVLIVVTLFIGYAIWSLVVWSKGTSPGKQLLGMKVVRLRDGRVAGWGTMFVREFVGKSIIGWIVGLVSFGILNFMLLWDRNNQEVWDKVVGTIVVDDRARLLG